MSIFQLCLKSLKYRFSIHLLLFLIVALATLIITGALLVGDSVRFSLRQLTDQRLGPVDSVFRFREMKSMKIFDRIQNNDSFAGIEPALVLNASLELSSGENEGIMLLGLSDPLWGDRPKRDSSIYINRFLSDKLGKIKDKKGVLRFSIDPLISPENLYGNRENNIQRMNIQLDGIIEQDQWPGAFDFYPNQKAPLLVFMPLDLLQKRIDRKDPKINTVLLLNKKGAKDLQGDLFKPTLNDLGIDPLYKNDHLFLRSTSFYFDSLQSQAIETVLSQKKIPGFPVFAYLANTIQKKDKARSIPYSLIAGIDLNDPEAASFFSLPQEILPTTFQGKEILVNQWLADRLDLKKGDRLILSFYLPESISDHLKERSEELTVVGILPMKGGILSREMVPDLKGLTDSDSLSDWDPPFPVDMKKIGKDDEEYWEQYRTAPKALIPLSTARDLWKSRFGSTSSYRIKISNKDESSLENDLIEHLDPRVFGIQFLPLRSLGIKASSGSTPFDLLFLSFSVFLIVSVLVLFVLLIRLTYAMKYRESGILLTMGFSPGSIFRLLLLETGIPILLGILPGIVGSIYYTKFLLYGLNHWWIDTIGIPFLQYGSSLRSFLIGGGLCLLILILLAIWNLRFLKSSTPAKLIFNKSPLIPIRQKSRKKMFWRIVLFTILLFSIAFLLYSGLIVHDPQIQAALFFISAGTLLFSLLLLFSLFLEYSKHTIGRSIFGLALRNLSRNTTRTLLTISLLASSLFMVFSVGVFHLSPPQKDLKKNINREDGGFSWIGEARLPFYEDPGDPSVQEIFFPQKKDREFLINSGIHFYPLRCRRGETGGCSNIYQGGDEPTLLGLNRNLIDRGGFLWGKKKKSDIEGSDKNPFLLLREPVRSNKDGIPIIPMILDQNTAMYSLHLYAPGALLPLKNKSGETVLGEVVTFLSNSIFQSEILINERDLLRYFPEVQGYHFLLADFDQNPNPDLLKRFDVMFRKNLSEYGFSTEETEDRLIRYYSVQNTYLAIFQALGGLGILLGFGGLILVQIRNVLERKKEFALMQAMGYTKKRMMLLVFWESGIILFCTLILAVSTSLPTLIPSIQNHLLPDGNTGSLRILFFTLGGEILRFRLLLLALFTLGILSGMISALFVLRMRITRTLKTND